MRAIDKARIHPKDRSTRPHRLKGPIGRAVAATGGGGCACSLKGWLRNAGGRTAPDPPNAPPARGAGPNASVAVRKRRGCFMNTGWWRCPARSQRVVFIGRVDPG
jgi:hypothetical protein